MEDAKASINFKIALSNSTAHNERTVKLDYNFPELSRNNESWKIDEIPTREKEVNRHCLKVSGRKFNKNAEPIREAVVNITSETTMEDLKKLATQLKEKKGIDCFQIYIHRDEGKSREELNHHAHMVFDWQDKKTGRTIKLNRRDLSEIQTMVSDSLNMKRGELRVNSNRERLEPIEYKRQQEELKLQQLQSQVEELEQKKNEATERNRAARAAHQRVEPKQPRRDIIDSLIRKGSEHEGNVTRDEISEAIRLYERLLATKSKEIEIAEAEYRELSESSIETVLNESKRIEDSDQYREFKRLTSQITELEADIRRGQRTIENRKSR